MNPNDYYRMKSAEIKEADIRWSSIEHRKWGCFRRR